MTAGKYNLHIEQGATFRRTFTTTTPSSQLANYTGYTARMAIRREVDDDDAIIELTTENGRIELGGTLGTVTIVLSDEETSTITRDGVYDLELISSLGVVERFLQGMVFLDPEVTR